MPQATESQRTYDAHQVRLIACLSCSDPRSVVRVLRGEPIRSRVAQRVETRTLDALGLEPSQASRCRRERPRTTQREPEANAPGGRGTPTSQRTRVDTSVRRQSPKNAAREKHAGATRVGPPCCRARPHRTGAQD